MPLVYSNMQLSEVVEKHTSLIPVLNRLGIRLGLGDKTVETICREYNLNTDFFLIVINTFLNAEFFPEKKLQSFHTSQIIDYLTKTNQYYLKFQLPNIERHLGMFISVGQTENSSLALIGKVFHSFRDELTKRIENDFQYTFPYFMELSESLQKGEKNAELATKLNVGNEEDAIEPLLQDLKSIMIKHLSGNYDQNLCYAVIVSLNSLEKDIQQHNRIRYRILSPMIISMQNQLTSTV